MNRHGQNNEIDIKRTGENIRKHLSRAGITVKAAAAELNYTPGAIYSWIYGDSIPAYTSFYKLAEILGVSMDNLVVRKDTAGTGSKDSEMDLSSYQKILFRKPATAVSSNDSSFESFLSVAGIVEVLGKETPWFMKLFMVFIVPDADSPNPHIFCSQELLNWNLGTKRLLFRTDSAEYHFKISKKICDEELIRLLFRAHYFK